MRSVALFSDDTELRDLVNQLEDYTVAYFFIELEIDELPQAPYDIDLAIFDFDVVPLSLLDEWAQFPRLHLPKMAVVSGKNIEKIEVVLDQLDNYVVRPLSKNSFLFRLNQQRTLIESHEAVSMLPMELKSALTSIKGYSDVIQHFYKSGEGILEADLLRYMTIIENRARYVERMIELVADTSRIIYTKGFHFNVYPIADIVEHAHEYLKRQLDGKSQTLDIILPDETFEIFCSQWYTIVVFREVLNNASTYSDDNTIITLNTEIQQQYILFTIQDTGMGMSDEFKGRIFGRFETDYELHRIHNVGGVGLSLYLCKQIIEMHGGEIWFESEEGVGTTFYFTLPLAE
jgi:signal transduction histidine kinase